MFVLLAYYYEFLHYITILAASFFFFYFVLTVTANYKLEKQHEDRNFFQFNMDIRVSDILFVNITMHLDLVNMRTFFVDFPWEKNSHFLYVFLLVLFKNINGYMSDSSKILSKMRVRYRK